MLKSGLGFLALTAVAGFSLHIASPALAPPPPPPPNPGSLTWTADVQHWAGGGWDLGMETAANHVEGGFSDWRLPKIAELQAALQIPPGEDGSWGEDVDGGPGVFHHWTSQTQGSWKAWAVLVSRDADGYPIPDESGDADKYNKTANFYGSKFVRP